ncbi:hypothetical protein Sjap_009624 [Stephania japonica]|uniref:BZIP domain-containing protein n=1 Tax=Stephania japonica TaxID=461633 RepID=A0AAP0JA76_9MAGN
MEGTMVDLVDGETCSDLNFDDLLLSFESDDGFADVFGDANNDLLLPPPPQPNPINNYEDQVVVVSNNNNPSPSPDYKLTTTSGGGGGSWGIREVEKMLLMEDENKLEEGNQECFHQIFSQILHQVSDDHHPDNNQVKTPDEEEEDLEEKDHASPDDDQISKKLKRQIRNRDAALRSRERKKMYVKDLEMKSIYLEGECMRLQRLLQCCAAENHALHLQLLNSKAGVASPSKQESAVLLLESLLLGSLLWLVGIVCLSPLPGLLCPALEAAPSMGEKDREIVDLVEQVRGAKNDRVGLGTLRLFFKCKQCKATRGRMKFVSFTHALVA